MPGSCCRSWVSGRWSGCRPGRRWSAHVGLDCRWHRLVRAGLALALVRFLGQDPGYWGTGVVRVTIMVQYFGQVFADRDVPWHYPWFYFAVDGPGRPAWRWARSGVQARLERSPLGPVSAPAGWHDRGLPGLFSTRVPVYDGERLFLARLSGLGPAGRSRLRPALGEATADLTPGRSRWRCSAGSGIRRGGATPVRAQLLQCLGRRTCRERSGSGLELTYWNDPVDHVLLDRLAADANRGRRPHWCPRSIPDRAS